jgi:hypothetical protein
VSRYEVRKWVGHVEETLHEGGPVGAATLVKAAVGAVIGNPFAGRHESDLSALVAPSDWLAGELAARAKALLGGRPIVGYGKGGIAGTSGEQEHVVACLTSVFGDALRVAVGGGEAWVSSFTKVGSAGSSIDLPLAHKDALYVRSHYDGVTLSLPDAPRPDELLICIGVSTGPRVHERSGGMTPEQISGGGLR